MRCWPWWRSQRADDDAVLALRESDGELLLTEDKDFGQLVYADEQATGGVILTRYPAGAQVSTWPVTCCSSSAGGSRSHRPVCGGAARPHPVWRKRKLLDRPNQQTLRAFIRWA